MRRAYTFEIQAPATGFVKTTITVWAGSYEKALDLEDGRVKDILGATGAPWRPRQSIRTTFPTSQ